MKPLQLFIFLVVLLTACDNKPKKGTLSPDLISNPSTAGSNDNQNLPVLEFEETNYHFGEVKQGEKLTHTFKFTNTGNLDLILATVSASCGCTVPEWSKEPIKPGDEGAIKVTFNTEGKTGMQSKTISVMSNSKPGTRVLTISAEIN
jgi:hypothetical protein